MPRGNQVIPMPRLFIKSAELDKPVTHYIRIRRETCPYLIHRVTSHLIPILPMTVNHFQTTTESSGHSRCHLQIFFRRTIPSLILVGANLDIKAIGMQSVLRQLVNHNRTIHASRQEYGYPFIRQILIHSCKLTHFFRISPMNPFKIQ